MIYHSIEKWHSRVTAVTASWHAIITDWAIDTVSSLLKIKNVESQKIKKTLFCGFERTITQ